MKVFGQFLNIKTEEAWTIHSICLVLSSVGRFDSTVLNLSAAVKHLVVRSGTRERAEVISILNLCWLAIFADDKIASSVPRFSARQQADVLFHPFFAAPASETRREKMQFVNSREEKEDRPFKSSKDRTEASRE